jgi:hypothetical protein
VFYDETIQALTIKYLLLTMQPLYIYADDSSLTLIRGAGARIADFERTTSSLQTERKDDGAPGSRVRWRVRVERALIRPISLSVTLTRRSDGRFNPFSGIPLGSFLIQSVESAPLHLGEVLVADVLLEEDSPAAALVRMLQPRYQTLLLLQLYKLIGSFEALGNPVLFVSDLSHGVQAFVKETVQLRPLQGAKALLVSATAGALHSVSLLTRLGGRTVAALSFDSEWLQQREVENITGDKKGILRGAANGLIRGVTGVVLSPVRGMRESGVTGFLAGVATGFMGVVSKPVSGVLDGIGTTAEMVSRDLRQQPSTPATTNLGSLPCRHTTLSPSAVEEMDSTHGRSVPSTPKNDWVASSPKGIGDGYVTRQRFLSTVKEAPGKNPMEKARAIISALGVHNYARHAEWKSFCEHTTPQEFYDWMSVAMDRVIAERILARFQYSSAVPPKLLSEQERVAVARAANLKQSLGTKEMLKFVTLEQFVRSCSLSEIKDGATPEDIQRRLARILSMHLTECVDELLSSS